MQKVVNIVPIFAGYVPIYHEEDLNGIIELPLLNACKDLYRKNIRTIMSSCNKYNVIGLNKYANDIKEGERMKWLYSYGEGYAWIMLDYDSLSEENKQILSQYHLQQQNRFLYSIHLEEDLDKSPDDFKHNYIESLYTPHYKNRVIVMRYELTENTTSKEVNEYFLSITSSLKPQTEKLAVEDETRYKLFQLANKYKKPLNQMQIFIDNSMFKDPLFKTPDNATEKLYGLKEEESLLWTLFVLAVLDNFDLLEEKSALMILSTNRNDIHLMYNGKEYHITTRTDYPKEEVLQFGRDNISYEKLQKEKELIDLFRKLDLFDYLQTQETKVNEKMKNL